MIENISTPELTIRMKANDHLIENLSSSKKLIIYRIVQEQINNILKHSKATESQVELKTVNNRLHLRIKDNGIGFDPSKKPGALV
jgi:Signal transduction histidine kinase